MPGLLQTPDDMFGSARFTCAIAAEFLVRLLSVDAPGHLDALIESVYSERWSESSTVNHLAEQ